MSPANLSLEHRARHQKFKDRNDLAGATQFIRIHCGDLLKLLSGTGMPHDGLSVIVESKQTIEDAKGFLQLLHGSKGVDR